MRMLAGRNATVVKSWMFTLTLVAALITPRARAETSDGPNQDVAVMVPPRTEAGIPAAMAERAVGVVSRALKSDRFSVIEPQQAVAIAESLQAESGRPAPEDNDLNQCTTADCAIWYRALLNAAVAVQMTLFTKVGPSARSNLLDSVTLVIVQRANVQFSGSAQVKDGDLEAAMLAAYRAAREKQIKGVGPWLTVRGEPVGAQVLVDGMVWGPLPHKDAVQPGIHTVVVRKNGFEESNQSVTVGDHSDAEAVVEIKLKRENAAGGLAATDGEAADKGEQRGRRSIWNYIAGGAAIAVGGVYAGGAAVSLAKDGDVSGDYRYEASTGTKLKLAAGLVGVAAGVTLCIWAPLRVKVAAEKQGAALTFEQRF